MKMWKKTMIGTLALSMIIGGSTSAFAAKPEWAGNPHKDRYTVNKKSDIKIEIKHNGKVKLKFKDVEDEAAWALEYIAKLAAQGVFNGYEDGSFRPNQTVSRIEAITAAVRQMGLQTEAESETEMSTDLHFKDADKIEKKYPWAVGYVAVAVENDLFMETDAEVQPERPADRLWATILLVKALGLEDKAKAAMNTELKFKDRSEIPAGAVGYVAVAVDKGLVTGYENNTFRPNKPVTRAELAALLDRTEDELPDDEDRYGEIAGVVEEVYGNKVTIKDSGKSVQYSISADAYVVRNDKLADLEDIKKGDKISAVLSDGKIVFLSVKGTVSNDDDDDNDDKETKVEGTITAIKDDELSVTKKGKTTVYEVDDDATIVRNNEVVKLSVLAVGDEISAMMTDDDIIYINVTKAVSNNDGDEYKVTGKYQGHRTEKGELVQISVTTQQSSGPITRIYNVSDDVDIEGGSAFSLIKGETDIELTIEDQEVVVITIKK